MAKGPGIAGALRHFRVACRSGPRHGLLSIHLLRNTNIYPNRGAAISDRYRHPTSHRGIHQRFNGTLHISARVDYGMKALMELTAVAGEDPARLVKADSLARDQEIPPKFLENILRSLRQAGIVASQRGADGGFRLDRPAEEVTVADVIRALDGPLAAVRGAPPEEIVYTGNAEHLREVWIATRAALREVLEHVTLADIAAGQFPSPVGSLLDTPGAWKRRGS